MNDTSKTIRIPVILSEEKNELNEFLEKYGNGKKLKIKPVKE